MITLVRVDTVRDQKDRHFSRARGGDVACEGEATQQSAKNVADATGAEVADECNQGETFLYAWYSSNEHDG